ncbi:TetR/AcrR family transcriptional regulator [Neobacillus sp. WH10]|uniref:TetR/AcrR family transcriptional regulator n=1 Tax=Neobacillus sp. WH10 TaxID=3047873 RepID=UPI0024C0F915|nr:TetR/AcrR family transcriptional regulator [Neobacillus sp. WH10]WHY76867.1 TetR/AcrR family transcriptional regulator [Neobacillus sp. WH10]
MSERHADRRIIRTKRMIRDALTLLMEEKGFEAITVRDLTERADINRGTFYLHYEDKYDLLEQCEEEIINGINKLTLKINPEDALSFDGQKEPFPFIVYLFEYLHENSSFMKAVLGPNGDASFQEKLKELIKRTFYQNILSKINQEDMLVPVDFLIAYVCSAHLGVIQHWLESGMEKSPREMALILARITLLGPRQVSGLYSKAK